MTVCSSETEYVLYRICGWLVQRLPDSETVLQCFPAQTTGDQTECEHVLSSAHKKKHMHNVKFSTQMHDFRCVFNVDSCPVSHRETARHTWRRDRRIAPSCGFSTVVEKEEEAKWTGEAQVFNSVCNRKRCYFIFRSMCSSCFCHIKVWLIEGILLVVAFFTYFTTQSKLFLLMCEGMLPAFIVSK